MTRLFVAVFPSEEAREHLRHRLRPVPARRSEKWHVTLVFLGDVPDDAAVVRALSETPPPAPFSLRLSGGGRFGPVVWAGLEGDVPALHTCQAAVRSSLATVGFPSDPRPFRPHLTVSYRFDRRLAAALTGYTGPPWTIEEFSLVSSVDGEYHRLWTG
ncbi:RNA 2',3'-cyclic phosphodiesterase [Actinoplanes derwentensis]|uniref:2'-5' RNA ligase n=1 Tax=Actinoplanes derwentensis TaxID=113562 RepID=A0A1H2CNU6_9ACTN|nr:RNA 2',3'-cyclic phosphodiesterase [Actinoplanes derwentensis]SDT72163.1 2'-5' RNA ligase [Actinoplanes derwentensis]